MARLILFLFLTALSVVCTAQTGSFEQKVAEQVRRKLSGGQRVSVCVLMEEQADVSAAKTLTTKEAKAQFVYEKLSGTAYRSQRRVLELLRNTTVSANSMYLVNAVAIEQADALLLRHIAALPEVARIVEDPWVFMDLPQATLDVSPTSTERGGVEWGVEKIGAPSVWAQGYTGQGITIGGADTGYDWDHPTLIEQYRGYNGAATDHNYHWFDAVKDSSHLNPNALNPCGFSSAEPCDDNAHGTHTMGTMVGDDGQGNQIGVAPGAKWVGCRNMERGWGKPSTYISCFEWFLAPTDVNGTNPKPDKAPHVINNSWYCADMEGCDQPGTHEMLRQAIINLKASGVVVVVSNGNDGPFCGSTIHPPAYFQESFSIGATNIADTIAGFSSRGPVFRDGSNRLKPNVSAPGAQVRSCTPNGGFASFSGTSMAGPHVAGLVALMLSANPDLAGHVDTIERMIEETAVPLFDGDNCGSTPATALPNNTHGYGRINAIAAVQRALQWKPLTTITTPPPSPIDIAPTVVRQHCTITAKSNNTLQIRVADALGRVWYRQDRLVVTAGQTITIDLIEAPAGVLFYNIDALGVGLYNGKLVKI